MALYGLLSPIFAPLFFPNFNHLSALILTYSIIPLGMLIRPFGSLFFGYLGDTYGRESTLFISLVGMSVISCMIGLTPTYVQIGMMGPLLLTCGKLTQNFLASGEVIGGAVYLLENTQEKYHNLLSSLYDCSTVLGIILASGGISLIYYFDVQQDGWRVLYLFGCITAIFGAILRWRIKPNQLTQLGNNSKAILSKALNTIWKSKKETVTIMLAAGFGYSTYSVALVMINGFVPLISDISHQQMIKINTGMLLFDLIILPIFGSIANIFSRQKMMITAALSAALSGIPIFMLLEGSNLLTVLVIRIWLVIVGVCFSATFYSWSQNLVPKEERYTILSFGYALGTQLFGGPTATVSLWLFKMTGIAHSAAWYWMGLGLASTIAIVICHKKDSLRYPQLQRLLGQ